MKRRWDDDVVFKNQARGTEDKGKRKEFVNVRAPSLAKTPLLVSSPAPLFFPGPHASLLACSTWRFARGADRLFLQDLLRSDFHRRFMGKYVR